MVDWLGSMEQSFEFYVVDPNTWKDTKQLTTVTSCSIDRDLEQDTLGSAMIDISDSVGECYIRIYLVTIQNGARERHPLGTFLVQTPQSTFDGKIRTVSMDAYTPLIELKENPPPIGYYVPKTTEIMDVAYRIARENMRGPVIKSHDSASLDYDFVSDTSDTWLSFLSDLIVNARYTLELDELGRVTFAPKQDTASLQPVWTYNDDNSSILYPDLDMDHDLYGVPNVVEVTYHIGTVHVNSRVVNDDPDSPTSTVRRGREITHRVTEPNIIIESSLTEDERQTRLDNYAKQVLRDLSTIEYTITYSHGYCPVRLGDCVRLNYSRAGLSNIKGKVIRQNIECKTGCKVTETVVFTNKLWG